MRLTTRSGSSLVLVPLLVLAAGPAQAHAALDRAEPSAGATLASTPPEVTLSFTEKLEPAFSTITVTDSAGQRVDVGNTRVSGNRMSVSLHRAGNGAYHVTWRVLAVDTHRTDGSFTFQVGQ